MNSRLIHLKKRCPGNILFPAVPVKAILITFLEQVFFTSTVFPWYYLSRLPALENPYSF